jgi:hypothetical protein
MKPSSIILSISFLLLFVNFSKAQQKYEREYRIKSGIVPQLAQEFIDSIGTGLKTKWYKEISLNGVSIEAKFKYKNKRFSVEFDTLGTLQDLEFIITKREIITEVYNNIEHNLDSLYHKWKFQKIQLHYEGKSKDIMTSINKNRSSDSIKVAYEIVLKGKVLGETQLYEITFDEEGETQAILQVIQDKADHLEY